MYNKIVDSLNDIVKNNPEMQENVDRIITEINDTSIKNYQIKETNNNVIERVFLEFNCSDHFIKLSNNIFYDINFAKYVEIKHCDGDNVCMPLEDFTAMIDMFKKHNMI